MLEVRHLRTLIALADAGTVSRAAERVHLTQSALSHQLKALESHYGLAMVKRHGQSVQLTEPGRRLVALGRTVMSEVQAAERDLAKLARKPTGTLRIALECHTCFDWLMPIMDAFRKHWPEVELDLVSGFHPNPLALLADNKTDLLIGSENKPTRGAVYHPPFRLQVLAVMPTDHRLKAKRYLAASDFAKETLITYPVPEERIDLIRRVLKPAKIHPRRRTTELTVAILQLVASRRGVAALPNWGIKNYVDYGYVIARRIGKSGLWSNLYGATTGEVARLPFAPGRLQKIPHEGQARHFAGGSAVQVAPQPALADAPRDHISVVHVVLDPPVRERGHASAAGDQLQDGYRQFRGAAPGMDFGGLQHPTDQVDALFGHRISDERFFREVARGEITL